MDTHHFRYARAPPMLTAADRSYRQRKDKESVRNIWLLLASVLAFLTVVNVVRKLSAKFSRPRKFSPPTPGRDTEKSDPETERQTAPRTSRLLSATAATFRIVLFRLPIRIGPNSYALVSELGFIFAYIMANLLWLFLDTRHLSMTFYKARAALMACAQLPFVVTLASKNNIISWMTGISHERLNVLHRAAGRTLFLFLWIHTISRAITLPPIFSLDDTFMRGGVAAITALTAGVFLSLSIFRHALFEFFFVTHVALMLTFLIGAYIHLQEQGYGSFVWPAILVWVLDRLFRAGRLLWNNIIRPEETAKSKATVELLTSDTIRLTFRRKFKWRPGQHAYISIPKISRLPSEAHPFTIASIPDNLDGTTSEDKDVVFLIRSRSGLTRRLKEFALENGTSSISAYVDGPYGSPPNLHKYSTCVLVAGGSGISYTLPLLLDLIRQSAVGGSSEVQRILFIWVVRGDGHLLWITEALTKALLTKPQFLHVEARIYLTGAIEATGGSPTDSSNNSLSKYEKEKVFVEPASTGDTPQVHHGRPDVATLLHDEISASLGPVSVDVAGPGVLTDSIRAALTTGAARPGAILKGSPPVTLHVETFGMSRT